MSIIINTAVFIVTDDFESHKTLLDFFERNKLNLQNPEDPSQIRIQGTDYYKGDYYALYFDGPENWNLWDELKEKFESEFKNDYFILSDVEFEGIFIDIKYNGFVKEKIEFSCETVDNFFEVYESDFPSLYAINWVKEKLNL